MASASCPVGSLKVAPMNHGCCIRVEGRGTMRESPTAKCVAMRTLDCDPAAAVICDLTGCDYLDSTFLGCLIHLYREYDQTKPARFLIAGSAALRKKLLGPLGLDKLIPAMEAAPATCGGWIEVKIDAAETKDLTRHIMECHRTLAELDTPMKTAFTKIAEQLDRELCSPPRAV